MTNGSDKKLVPHRWIAVATYPLWACTVGLVLAGLDLSRLTGLWPCDIACQGGAHYQQIGGVSVIWPALAVHLLIAVLAWRDFRRGGWCAWSIRLIWFVAGVSVFFALISSELDLSCPYCRTIHFAAFVLLGLATPFPRTVRWWQAGTWLVAGWLVTNAIFHHAVVADVVRTTPPGDSLPMAASTNAADRGRHYGATSATKTLDVVIDLTCGHCAEQYRPLMEALKPIIAAKRVQVIVRHLVRPSQPASLPASELALAAAAIGEHATAMEVLLGSNPDAGFAGLKARLAEVVDATKLERVLTADPTQFTALIADDQQRISQLGMGPRTPSAALSSDGKVVKRWSGMLPVADIVAALDGTL